MSLGRDMQVQALYITNVKETTGKSDEWVSMEGVTLRHLLEKLSHIYGCSYPSCST